MKKSKLPPLTPPDRNQCQAFRREGCWPDAKHFMNIGPRQMVRCKNKPTVIVKENKPSQDGRRGSMALCDDCLKRAIDQLGGRHFTSSPIAKKGRS